MKTTRQRNNAQRQKKAQVIRDITRETLHNSDIALDQSVTRGDLISFRLAMAFAVGPLDNGVDELRTNSAVGLSVFDELPPLLLPPATTATAAAVVVAVLPGPTPFRIDLVGCGFNRLGNRPPKSIESRVVLSFRFCFDKNTFLI